MIQIRIHGRGGQGVVTAAELIAIAGFKTGLYTQALPSFGVERSGAPIQAFARMDDTAIIIREHIYQPDFIIIQDASLLASVDVLFGANKKTVVMVNTGKTPKETWESIKSQKIQSFIPAISNIKTIDATKIALQILGRNLMNTVILGAFAKLSGHISLKSLNSAIAEKFAAKGPDIIAKNQTAATSAYEMLN
ncbi:pyruvate ferredoxin oxidoreductase [Candidatus Falkowbacteria bacterium CG10_big_fil_rev_8_21_14_0_10_39_9]|uniref:Pyruvate ferredoxin oxidoreductase n=1 Tax=Candidatus Falkowbacteria bacterium CG10_big_fil_rev_8_21_14_0_10_39_9 TaxID=1974566 RepID=A0A2M6WQ32_9BACT|nr:MAG: pyruvate ferredoxin oxidoreductase [Candidatus Falkowbacteria bacterium CG10_big_fil_rev_8_21_14_0_10_39_9]